MFDGRDYQQSFEDALTELTEAGGERDIVLGQLVSLEFTLWEAIRGAMIVTGNMAGLIAIAPILFFAWQADNWSWMVGCSAPSLGC